MFELADPDTVLVVDTVHGRVQEGADDLAVDATMTMSSDVANAYWQGKVNLPLAMAKGQIKVSGEIATLLRLAPLTKKLYPTYVERLRGDGRDDLLVA
jgi:putative sterol carrier protein